MGVVVAVDAGTTGIRAVAFDEQGRVVHWVYDKLPALPSAGVGRARSARDQRRSHATLGLLAADLAASGIPIAAVGPTDPPLLGWEDSPYIPPSIHHHP